MFEQLKQILTIDYQNELSRFDYLKRNIDYLESKMLNDKSEDEYQNKIKELNKKYGALKRNAKEYKDELNSIQIEYSKELKKFEEIYNQCMELKHEAANINIYIIQKKLEQLMNAASLEDLKLNEEEATQIIEEKQGIEPIVYNDDFIEEDEVVEETNIINDSMVQENVPVNTEQEISVENTMEDFNEMDNSFNEINNEEMNNVTLDKTNNIEEKTSLEKNIDGSKQKKKHNKLLIVLLVILLLVIIASVVLNYLPLFEV